MKKRQNWTYMLRILRNPDQITMDRLGMYMLDLAELIGKENRPIFKGIKNASTGLKVSVADDRIEYVDSRIKEAANDPESKPGKLIQKLDSMLAVDGIARAELLDAGDNVIYLFRQHIEPVKELIKVQQAGTVDGVVTGLVGADNTMHLHLRDRFDRDLKLIVRNERLARDLLLNFRSGSVRLSIHGTWIRGDSGWYPEANKCSVDGFEILSDSSLIDIFSEIKAIPNNGWSSMENPIAFWEELRGAH